MSEIRNIKEGDKLNKASSGKVVKKIDFDFRSSTLIYLLLIVLAILAVVFCAYQIARANSHQKKLNTETALMRTISKTIDAEGFVLREESVIPYEGNGTVVPEMENGSKVAVGDTVAKVYAAQSAAQDSIRYASLAEERNYYTDLADFEADAVSVGMELYNQNALNQLLRLQDAMDTDTLASISGVSKALGSDITKKQIAIGKDVDVNGSILQLDQEMLGLSGSLANCMELKADRAGFYMNETDGYEAVGDYQNVASITPEDVTKLLNEQPKQNSGVGKLITQFNWYLVCKIPAADAQELAVGDTVKVIFSEYVNEEIQMKVYAINGGREKELSVVLTSDLMNREIAALRVENIKIRTEEYTGYAVNPKAIQKIDDTFGVYIQLGNIIRFRKIEILYSDGNVVLAENKEENGYLRLYDEIIIEGKDLSDGQIVS